MVSSGLFVVGGGVLVVVGRSFLWLEVFPVCSTVVSSGASSALVDSVDVVWA